MSFIINHINNHLMIHFSEVITRADITITDETNRIISEFIIENKDFINRDLKLEAGNYQIKIRSKEKEILKTIIIK